MHYKIKITEGHGWYTDKIGQKINAIIHGGYFYKLKPDGTPSMCFVQPDHCKIIKEVFSKTEKHESLGVALIAYEKWWNNHGTGEYMEIISTKELLLWYKDNK